MKKIASVILAALLALPIALDSAQTEQIQFKPKQYVTQNVIIINTDGLRYADGLGSQDKYKSQVWNYIRPQGTILTKCYNQTTTYTAPGHACCITGAWQYEPNNGRIRPSTPTIFEYYRRQFKAPPEDVLILPGKGNSWHLNYSTFPGFGRDYEAPFYALGAKDDEVIAELKKRLTSQKPKLVYAILPEVDATGHTGDYKKYTDAIIHADKLIWETWNFIQADPNYKDKTTLILVTDHGRHTDGVRDGFKSHGDACEGCRHIYSVMIGPDIKKNNVISAETEQVDIAPTVGQLLGFATPASDGKTLWDALVERPAKTIPTEMQSYILALEQECKYFLQIKYSAILPKMLDASLKIPIDSLGHSVNDAIFLNGVIDASLKLKRNDGIEYAKKWADRWIADDLKKDDISDAACAETLLKIFEATKAEKYKENAKTTADWLIAYPYGKSEKEAILSKPVKFGQGNNAKQVRIVKAENLYALMPLLAHCQKIFGGDYLKFSLNQWASHKYHLYKEQTKLFNHFAIIGTNIAINPINWSRANAYALAAIVDSQILIGNDTALSKQINSLIRKEEFPDEIIDKQQQNGLWFDDLSGQVSDYDTVSNCLILGSIAGWQSVKKSPQEPQSGLIFTEDALPMSTMAAPSTQSDAFNSSAHHAIGAWELWKNQVSSSGLVYGSALPAQNIERIYEGFTPPVYCRDRGFFIEGQGAFMSALARLSTLSESLVAAHKRIPPIK